MDKNTILEVIDGYESEYNSGAFTRSARKLLKGYLAAMELSRKVMKKYAKVDKDASEWLTKFNNLEK